MRRCHDPSHKEQAERLEALVNGMKAMSEYCEEVRSGNFPGDEHCYHMIEGEESKFLEIMSEVNP